MEAGLEDRSTVWLKREKLHMAFRYFHIGTKLAKIRRCLHGHTCWTQNRRRYASRISRCVYVCRCLMVAWKSGMGRKENMVSSYWRHCVNGEKLLMIRETPGAMVCPPSPWPGCWLLPFAQPRIMGPWMWFVQLPYSPTLHQLLLSKHTLKRPTCMLCCEGRKQLFLVLNTPGVKSQHYQLISVWSEVESFNLVEVQFPNL